MSELLVSVLMPAYNAEKFIEKSIESILHQTYDQFELLILDDCSIDNTYKLISQFNDSRIFAQRNEINLGYLKSCNKLFTQCKGHFITFQDADDWSDPFRLEKMVCVFKRQPHIGLCASNHYWVMDDKVIPGDRISSELNFLRKAIPHHFPCVGSTVMISRKVLKDVGGYHPFFDRLGGEDFEWIARIVDRYDSVIQQDPLYYYRYNPNSVTNKNLSIATIVMDEILKNGISQRRNLGKNPFDEWDGKGVQLVIMEIGLSRGKISELYRSRAAREIDRNNLPQALFCLKETLRYNLFSFKNLRTLFYFNRTRMRSAILKGRTK